LKKSVKNCSICVKKPTRNTLSSTHFYREFQEPKLMDFLLLFVLITFHKTWIKPEYFGFKSYVFWVEKLFRFRENSSIRKLITFYHSWAGLDKIVGWKKLIINGPKNYKPKQSPDYYWIFSMKIQVIQHYFY
jgi:hypothetical protein